MNLGFCWVFSDPTPEAGVARLREYGFDGVELWLTELRPLSAERWASALRANEMRCFQACPYFDFVHGETRVAEMRDVERHLSLQLLSP